MKMDTMTIVVAYLKQSARINMTMAINQTGVPTHECDSQS